MEDEYQLPNPVLLGVNKYKRKIKWYQTIIKLTERILN